MLRQNIISSLVEVVVGKVLFLFYDGNVLKFQKSETVFLENV